MSKHFRYLLLIIILAQITGCKEPFEPAIKSSKSGYLVVDGIILNGKSETVVTLTRTTGLHDSINIVYEQNAIVQIEGEDNSIFALAEKSNGQYTADSLDLNGSIQYRLRIRTKDGNSYISDFVPVLSSPPIDSISWIQEKNASYPHIYDFSLYVNTHDPDNKTRYYLWSYEETWKYHSPIRSYVKFSDDSIVEMTASERDKVYYCWQSDKSKSILIGNSVKLSQDVISMHPLTSVKGNSLKKSYIYSINVKQYALTQKAYEFYGIMQKNSEATGSLFDPQPSEINGNIKNADNPSEPVIGYVSISTLASKRKYINKDFYYYYSNSCVTVKLNSLDVSLIQYPFRNYPVNFIFDMSTAAVLGYVIAPSECVDCKALGGSNVKPVFWPDSL